jgi:hypothetical protein
MSPHSALVTCLALSLGAHGPDAEPLKINTRSFAIPIAVDAARRGEIDRLVLFNSSDRGQTRQQADSATVDAKQFCFNAQADGEYWFHVQVVGKNGQATPADIRSAPPALPVRQQRFARGQSPRLW